MKSSLFAFGGALLIGVLVSGCAFDPYTMARVSPRDTTDMYVDAGAPEVNRKTERAKVAVKVSLGAYANKGYEGVADAMDSGLNADLSNFAFFELVDRKSLFALVNENVLNSDNPFEANTLSQVGADYIVVARLTSMVLAQGRLTAQFDFKWLNVASQRVVMTKSITPDSKLVTGGYAQYNAQYNAQAQTQTQTQVQTQVAEPPVVAALSNMAADAAKQFAHAITLKYMPPVRVVETRGNGAAARISIGKNYGLAPRNRVCFYEIVDNSALGGKKRDFCDLASGTVEIVEADSAWVKVNDPDKTNVRKGVYVRVLEGQDKGVLNNVMGTLN